MALLDVESSLIHDDFKRSLVFFSEVDRGSRHVLIYDLGKHLSVPAGVDHDSIYKSRVTTQTKEVSEVTYVNLKYLGIFVGYALLNRCVKFECVCLPSAPCTSTFHESGHQQESDQRR